MKTVHVVTTCLLLVDEICVIDKLPSESQLRAAKKFLPKTDPFYSHKILSWVGGGSCNHILIKMTVGF